MYIIGENSFVGDSSEGFDILIGENEISVSPLYIVGNLDVYDSEDIFSVSSLSGSDVALALIFMMHNKNIFYSYMNVTNFAGGLRKFKIGGISRVFYFNKFGLDGNKYKLFISDDTFVIETIDSDVVYYTKDPFMDGQGDSLFLYDFSPIYDKRLNIPLRYRLWLRTEVSYIILLVFDYDNRTKKIEFYREDGQLLIPLTCDNKHNVYNKLIFKG